MKITDLIPDNVYQLRNKKTGKKEEAVFQHIGETGWAIFNPPGEPSFQDCFGLKNFDDWEISWLRVANREDNPFL